jgi:hypothetical protein
MVKRIASAVLWFLAIAWGFNYISLMTGAPAIIGLLLGAAIGSFVVIDPFHLIWSQRIAPPGSPAPDAVAVSEVIRIRI